jgi:hypothetical protein
LHQVRPDSSMRRYENAGGVQVNMKAGKALGPSSSFESVEKTDSDYLPMRLASPREDVVTSDGT